MPPIILSILFKLGQPTLETGGYSRAAGPASPAESRSVRGASGDGAAPGRSPAWGTHQLSISLSFPFIWVLITSQYLTAAKSDFWLLFKIPFLDKCGTELWVKPVWSQIGGQAAVALGVCCRGVMVPWAVGFPRRWAGPCACASLWLWKQEKTPLYLSSIQLRQFLIWSCQPWHELRKRVCLKWRDHKGDEEGRAWGRWCRFHTLLKRERAGFVSEVRLVHGGWGLTGLGLWHRAALEYQELCRKRQRSFCL